MQSKIEKYIGRVLKAPRTDVRGAFSGEGFLLVDDRAVVLAGQYYYKAVLWAVEKNITKGTSADKFSPDSTCTRGQIVTFLYRDMAG